VLKGGNSFSIVAEEVVPRLRSKGVVKTPAPEAKTFRQALFGAGR
jgi:hypothetical protein